MRKAIDHRIQEEIVKWSKTFFLKFDSKKLLMVQDYVLMYN